jgi:hypothetical protein
MPALTTGTSNIELAHAWDDICACYDLAQFPILLERLRCGLLHYDRANADIGWDSNIPDQETPQRSSSPELHLDIVAWEEAAGNQVPCRALQNTVKWFQLWTTLASCFLILLI